MVKPRRNWQISISSLWLLVGLAGCGSEQDRDLPQLEVRDSAGIEIIRSGLSEDSSAARWQIIGDPVLEIGSVEGDPAYLFEWIGDATRTPDGQIVLTDRRSMDIRVFGPDGTHQETFGRSGPGPEEFGGPPFLAWREPDTLVVWDGGHFRLSRYDLAGNLLDQGSYSEAAIGIPMTGGVHAWQVAPDGSVLWAGRAPSRSRVGINNADRSVALIDGPTGRPEDFGMYPMNQGLLLKIGIGFANWFAPSAQASLGPPPFRVAVSSPERWEIRFFDSGGALQRILRASIPRVAVTSEVRAERRAYLVDWAEQFRLPPGQGESVDDQFPVPDSLPAIASIRWDRAGNLWVGRREPDPNATKDYDVFDLDGSWISTVTFPPELGRILEIGEDYVLSSWLDDLNVPYLRMYRLQKPGR